jgi:hypothetical protein
MNEKSDQVPASAIAVPLRVKIPAPMIAPSPTAVAATAPIMFLFMETIALSARIFAASTDWAVGRSVSLS